MSVLRSRNRLSASEAGLVWGLGYCIVEEVVYGFYSFSYDTTIVIWMFGTDLGVLYAAQD